MMGSGNEYLQSAAFAKPGLSVVSGYGMEDLRVYDILINGGSFPVSVAGFPVTPAPVADISVSPSATPSPVVVASAVAPAVSVGVFADVASTSISVPPVGVSLDGLDYFTLSFYDPLIGRDFPDIRHVNCSRWDDLSQDCLSALRSGDDFRDYYAGHSVRSYSAGACRYELFIQKAEFEVLSPSWLRDLTPLIRCMDTGEAVQDRWLDVLIQWRDLPMPYEDFPWGELVIVRRVK